MIEDRVRGLGCWGGERTACVNTNQVGRGQSRAEARAKAGISGVPFLQEGVELITELRYAKSHPVLGGCRWSTFIRAVLCGASEVLGCPDLPRGILGAGYQVPQEFKVICSLPGNEGQAVKATIHKGGF